MARLLLVTVEPINRKGQDGSRTPRGRRLDTRPAVSILFNFATSLPFPPGGDVLPHPSLSLGGKRQPRASIVLPLPKLVCDAGQSRPGEHADGCCLSRITRS